VRSVGGNTEEAQQGVCPDRVDDAGAERSGGHEGLVVGAVVGLFAAAGDLVDASDECLDRSRAREGGANGGHAAGHAAEYGEPVSDVGVFDDQRPEGQGLDERVFGRSGQDAGEAVNVGGSGPGVGVAHGGSELVRLFFRESMMDGLGSEAIEAG